jgi:hypothetical protein
MLTYAVTALNGWRRLVLLQLVICFAGSAWSQSKLPDAPATNATHTQTVTIVWQSGNATATNFLASKVIKCYN